MALVAVAALFALAAPAQAQTEPVWSTTMTVGEHTTGSRGFYVRPATGSLDSSSFTIPGTTYHVERLHVVDDLVDSALIFRVDTELSGYADYTLEFADETLPLAEVATTGLGDRYFSFSQTWLAANASVAEARPISETTLAVDARVPVCLRTATQVCPGGGTTVTNTAATGTPEISGTCRRSARC